MTDPLKEMLVRNWPHGVKPNWKILGFDEKITPWFAENGMHAYTTGGLMVGSFVYHDGMYWFRNEQHAFAFKMRWG